MQKMINFDGVANQNKKQTIIQIHTPNYLYRLLKGVRSGYGKGHWWFNLISHQLEIEKIYLCA